MRVELKTPIDFVKQVFRKLTKVTSYPTITVEYPFVLKPLPKLARLEITNDFAECTACRVCEKTCPVNAIQIESEDYSEKTRKPKNSKGQDILGTISQFKIDYASCTFCGLCVEKCDAESLSFDKIFAKPHYLASALKVDLVHIPRSMRKDEIYK